MIVEKNVVDWIAIQLPKINKVLQQIDENCGAKIEEKANETDDYYRGAQEEY